MAHYIILDTNAGLLQWTAYDVQDEMAALKQFDDAVGIRSDDEELDLDEWRIIEATEAMIKEADAWWENGAPSSEAPAFLK